MTLKPTAPETLALAAATLLAAALALPTRAEAPRSKSGTAADLKRIAAAVAALPVPPAPGEHGEPDPRTTALLMIAERQNTQGDHAGARETLNHVKTDMPADKDLWRDAAAIARCGVILEHAAYRYDAGEVAKARADIRRLIDVVDRPDPADAEAMRSVARMMRTAFTRGKGDPDGPAILIDDAVRQAGAEDEPDQGQPVPERLEIVEALLSITAKHRDTELVNRAAASIIRLADLSEDPALIALMEAHVGAAYLKAGDERQGRERLASARRRVDTIPAGRLRETVAQLMVDAVAEADLDEALKQLPTLPSARRNAVLRRVLERGVFCTITPTPWDDAPGIKITIGDPGLAPKERLRAALPGFIALARGIEEDALRARTLAVLAHLQARGGDPAGAMATAEAIPDLHRPEGPVDGFYDSVKPATFALLALRRAEAGDQKNADAAFARSRELARAVASEPERVVAWIVLAEKLEAAGRRDRANAVLADAIPLAKAQPEPRRSRMLNMLARTQLKTAGVDAAAVTADAIRDEPGLEKAAALDAIAHALHEKGDDEAARRHARRALVRLSRASDPRPNPNARMAVSRISFIDYDAETPQAWLEMNRAGLQASLSKLVVDAPAPPPAGPPWQQQMLRSADVADAFRRGGIDEALKAVESLDSPSSKASALHTLAYEVAKDEETKK